MEAWDTLAAIEEGLTTLQRSPDDTAAVEQLAVLTHRLRGAAALSGFPHLAALAAAMEDAVDRVSPGGAEPYSLTTLNDMLFALKTSLDHIGETGAEDAETIAQLLMPLAPSAPEAPVDDTSRRLDELDRFFTEQHDVLEYFLPEAVEHLESMAQSLVALESEGSSESELAALFRAVHTLKGAAYTVGCGVIGDLAHRIEDMLGEVREHTRPLDAAAIETVFAGLDALRMLVRSAEERSDTRAATYERATALLDALPAIGAATVELPVSVEPELEPTADTTLLAGVGAPSRPSIEAIPQSLEPVEAVESEETLRRLDELDRFFTEQHDVLEYFLPEAVEHLESMAQSLVALESEGSSESELAALFRAVHTLKGAAYTVGCGVIGDLAHRIEDMLGEVREQKRPLDRGAIETVFAGLDALRLLVRSVEERSDTRVAAYERATALLDALPPIGAPIVESPSIESELEQVAGATVMTSAGAPSQVSLEETPQSLEPVEAVEPVEPAAAPAETATRRAGRSQKARDAAAGRVRPSIRVSLDRLDGLMNLVGELVIARSRLERHLVQLEQAGELLSFTQSRMTQTVVEFETKYADRMVPPVRPSGGGVPEPGTTALGDVFDELEFDRYDDFNLLARRVGEISNDLTEIQHQVTGLIRIVREDAGGVQRLSGALRDQITRARMVPVGRLFAPFVRMVRDGARAAGKSVALDVQGETVEMDTTIVELMADPLIHLVRNAIAHGIETEEERRGQDKPPQGTIHLGAAHKGGSIYIEVADDGRGIDVEAVGEAARRGGFVTAETLARLGERDILDLIFLPGLSTASAVTTEAGRGVGMDVVRENVGRLGGEIEVETERGRGTRFRIRLPLTVAISDALTVNVGSQTLAIPVSAVKGAVVVRPEEIRTTDGVESVEIEGENLELVRLDRLLQIPEPESRGALSIVTLRTGRRTLAVVVDEFLSKEEIVIKSLGTFLQGVGPFAGATVTGQGRVILLLDSLKLLDMSAAAAWPHAVEEIRPEPEAVAEPVVDARRRVMLVDDSLSVRKFVGGMLERAGFHVTTARDGAEALQQLSELTVDVLITDLEMPRLNGYELIRGLSRQPTTRDLPVVILTTRAGAKHVNLARELGVDHYVAKPVDEASFVQLIEVLAVATAARPGS